jgi:hypothetical protein
MSSPPYDFRTPGFQADEKHPPRPGVPVFGIHPLALPCDPRTLKRKGLKNYWAEWLGEGWPLAFHIS